MSAYFNFHNLQQFLKNDIATNVLESNFEDEIANVASSLQMFIQFIKSQITILIEIVDKFELHSRSRLKGIQMKL
jgi:hypothetical protein